MSTTITDLGGLQAMKDNLSEDYVIGNDIDASATSTWNSGAGFEPVGSTGSEFTGTFDGAGYTISNLYIDRSTTDYVGLFGYTKGSTIQDVILSSVNITGDDGVGALIGEIYGDPSPCTISGCSSSGTVTGDRWVGGLIGDSYNADIDDCYSSCVVTGTDDEIGGLLGQFDGEGSGTIDDSYATGAVSGSYNTGGFAGEILDCTVSECYATGNVTSDKSISFIGGFVGVVDGSGTINNCYARGDTTTIGYAGGFIGYNDAGTISNCYSTGAVTGGTVGGFCEFNDGTITNCFWDTQTSGQTTSDGGTGKDTTQMKDFCTYHLKRWDMRQIDTDRNSGYPYLEWEYGTSTRTWAIYGSASTTRCFTIPDVLDLKGRVPKGATVRAYRADDHTEITAAKTTIDTNGNAEVCNIPLDVDAIFHVTWGGSTLAGTQQERWFYSEILALEAGGTGSSTVAGARSNLGMGITDSPQFETIELGHASDTTLSRNAAGELAVEGVVVLTTGSTVGNTFNGTFIIDCGDSTTNVADNALVIWQLGDSSF